MAGPFYHAADADLGAALGQSLGTALFGNPAAALKLQEAKQRMAYMAAEQANASANAGKATEETRGLTTQNDAVSSLGNLIKGFAPAAAPAVPSPPADPLAPLPDASAAPAAPEGQAVDPAAFRSRLVPLIAAMATANGTKVDPNAIAGVLSSFTGNDSLAREGLVGQGKTPGKDFALTPGRADDIAQQGYDADLNKATTVEGMRGQVTERGQNIESSDRQRGQNIESGDRRRGQDLAHGDRLYGDNLKVEGSRIPGWSPPVTVGGDNSVAAVQGKEALMSQRLGLATNAPIDPHRAPEVFDAIAASEGPTKNNNPGNIIDSPFARSQPGYVGADSRGFAVFNSPQAGRQAGVSLLSTYFSRGQNTIQNIVEGMPVPKASAKASAPKPLNQGTEAVLFGHQGQQGFVPGELDKQIAARRINPDAGTLANMRQAITARFQANGGNAAEAVGHVLDTAQAIVARHQAGGANASQLHTQALAAISQGADPAQVKARYKQMTGQELQGS